MRNIFHTAISILMWCLFGYYWYVVGRRQITASSVQAIGVLALITLVGVLLTIWWISHNKKLASRNRRLNAPPTVPEVFETDYLGRTLVTPGLDLLKKTATIIVSVDEENHKIYTVADGMGD
jgi:hypothetical protein